MEWRDVGELEADREIGQLARGSGPAVDPARAAEERLGAPVEAPEAVLPDEALRAETEEMAATYRP